MNESCGCCRYFNAMNKQCRRNPPQLMTLEGKLGQPQMLGTWPPTQAAFWCGEFKRNEETDARIRTAPGEVLKEA